MTMSSQLSSPLPIRSLLKEKAYSEIKERIQDGRLAGGTFLSERQLVAILGMSKTPIKAALERLELEGFVTVSPQQGIVVRELSVREIAEQFELRKLLEGFVVKAITGKLTKKQLSPIVQNLRKQSAAESQQSVSKFIELDTEFHLLLCHAYGNTAISECLSQHRSKMHRVISQVMSKSSGRLAEAVKEHRAILAAIKSDNATLAVQLVEKHLEFGKQCLLSSRWS